MSLNMTIDNPSIAVSQVVTVNTFTLTEGNANDLSVAVRNAKLDQVEATIGTAPILEIRSGSPPATPASSDSGTLLVSITLPTDWLAAASSGSISKSGTWQATAVAAGTAGHFRIKNSAGTVTHIQGTVTQV